MRLNLRLALLAALLTTASSTVYANDWVTAGSAGVPAEDNINPVLYNVSNNAVNFAGSNTGDIYFTYPVVIADNTAITQFRFTASGDAGAGFYIEVTLRSTDLDNDGAVTNVSGACTSNASAVTQYTCNFTDVTVDTDADAYYFFARLHRDSTSANPTLYSIELF